MNTTAVRDHPRGLKRGAAAGAAAGLLAGILMAVAAVLYSFGATPLEASLPMKNVAAVWFGVEALIGDWATVVIGTLTHLVTATLFGLVFGLLMDRNTGTATGMAGALIYATVIWFLMTWFVLPWINSTMAVRVDALPGWWWYALHLIYGLVLGLTPLLRRQGEPAEPVSGFREQAAAPV